ncbi:MAG: Rieske (2Fe-2S) protein [Pseudomonadota bacterium]
MPAKQQNATIKNPNSLNMTVVARYERVIRAKLDRVWENVLDWEHLPHLHATSFDHVTLDEAGDWGWRTFSDPAGTSHIELTVADEASYVSRTYAGGQQNAEIWTYLAPQGDYTAIRVEFHMPNVDPARADRLGEHMLRLYTRLWDEDEAMMIARQQRLDAAPSHAREQCLGPAEDLSLPLVFELGGREYRLTGSATGFRALPTTCPHLLGPLSVVAGNPEELHCPWHGYRFDLRSRACLAPATASCRLPPLPEVSIDDRGQVFVRLAPG